MALPNISAGTIRSTLGSDIVASLETGLSDAEARVSNILAAGRRRHIKGNCGAEPLLFPGPCDPAQMRKFLIQPELYEQARQKLKNALAVTPAPADRERWFSASARWALVMRAADNLAWEWRAGLPVGTRSKTPGRDPLFGTPDADAFAEDTRKRVFDAAQRVAPWAHKGERKVHIDLAKGLRVVKGAEATTRGELDRVMWTEPVDTFQWGPWLDYDTVGVYRDCGGIFGSPCPGYPDGKRYHRTIYSNGATRVQWWKKHLEVLSRYPLADLLAYAWGGYSQYLDLNAASLGFTPAQMRAISEAKNKADSGLTTIAGAVDAAAALGAFVPVIGEVCAVISAALYAISEVLAAGCMFSFHQFQERVIDSPECGAWGEGVVATDTVPKMYGTLIAQGFDPQARLDELNAPPREEPTTPAWLVPAAAVVGGVVVGAVIGKVVL